MNYLTISQALAAANHPRLIRQTVSKACASGRIKAVKFGNAWAIVPESFHKWFEGYPHPPGRKGK